MTNSEKQTRCVRVCVYVCVCVTEHKVSVIGTFWKRANTFFSLNTPFTTVPARRAVARPLARGSGRPFGPSWEWQHRLVGGYFKHGNKRHPNNLPIAMTRKQYGFWRTKLKALTRSITTHGVFSAQTLTCQRAQDKCPLRSVWYLLDNKSTGHLPRF